MNKSVILMYLDVGFIKGVNNDGKRFVYLKFLVYMIFIYYYNFIS